MMCIFCFEFGGMDDVFKQSWHAKCEKFRPLGMESMNVNGWVCFLW